MVYKMIELVGVSPKSFAEAAQDAVTEAAKTVRDIGWIEVTALKGKVEDNKIVEYQTILKVGFRVER